MSEYRDNEEENSEEKGKLERVKDYLEDKRKEFNARESSENIKDYALNAAQRTKNYFKDDEGKINLVKMGEPLRYLGAAGTGAQGIRSAYTGTEEFIDETLDELYKAAQNMSFQEFQQEGATEMYKAFDNFKETINSNIKWPFFAYGMGEALNAAYRLRTEDLNGTEKFANVLKAAPVTTPAISQATDDNLLFSTFLPAACVIAGYALEYSVGSEETEEAENSEN